MVFRSIYVISTAIGAAVMFAAATPYGDALTNIQTWVDAAGLKAVSLPSSIDSTATMIGLAFVSIGLFGIFWPRPGKLTTKAVPANRHEPILASLAQDSQAVAYTPVKHLDGADYDIVARDSPLRVSAIRTPDYTDVSVDLFYKNRSQHSLWMSVNGIHLSVDGKMPSRPDGSISLPFSPEKTTYSPMGTVRLYSNVAGKSGVVSFNLLFGRSKETARTLVFFKFMFIIKNDPSEMDKKESLGLTITQDDTGYQIIQSEDEKRQ